VQPKHPLSNFLPDIHLGNDWTKFPPLPIMSQATPDRLKSFYDVQLKDPSYQNFLNTTNATIFGTIDDHDMGMNNGDETYEFKQQSGVQFLEFTGEDRNNIMFKRALNGNGVYGVKVFEFDGDRGGNRLLSDEEAGIDPDVVGYDIEMKDLQLKEYKEKRVAIFLLDARTNRSPWGEGFDAWKRNYSGDFLGEPQWDWFETAILKSDAAVNIIVNGLQVHPFRHPNANTAEQWAQFPASRQRLYDAILRGGVRSPILISGDVHMAQLMRKDCWLRSHPSSPTRPLIEFTTSGMTHSWGSVFASSQKFHETWRYYPMHVMSKTIMTVAHAIFPMPDLMDSGTRSPSDVDQTMFENGGAEGGKQGKQYSLEKNFGEVEIFWKNKTIVIRAIGEDANAPPLLSASFSMDQLSGLEPTPGAINDIKSFQNRGGFMIDGNIIQGSESVCVNHRGTTSDGHFLIGVIAMTLVLSFFLLGPQFLLLHFIVNRWKSRKNTNRI